MMKRIDIFRILTVLYLVAVGMICFMNVSGLPDIQETFLGIRMDKIVHFLMFLPFPFLTFNSLRPAHRGVAVTLLIIIGLLAVGCLIAWGTEFIQSKLPYREMDTKDFMADFIGLVCGAIATFFIQLFHNA